MFLIGAIMGLAAQVVSVPGSIVSGVIGGVVAPTGSTDVSEIIAMITLTVLPQILVLAVQAITLVVQGTGATLIYLDSRMRYEGLDQTLLRHVERAALGASDAELGDPYAVDPAREVSKTPPPKQAVGYVAPPSGYAASGYPAPYPGQPHPGQAPYPGQSHPGQAPHPRQPYPGQAYPPASYPQPSHSAQPAPPNAAPTTPPPARPAPGAGSADGWAAPGAAE
jgi:hypothetical protein